MGIVSFRRNWGFRSICAELSRPFPSRYSHIRPVKLESEQARDETIL